MVIPPAALRPQGDKTRLIDPLESLFLANAYIELRSSGAQLKLPTLQPELALVARLGMRRVNYLRLVFFLGRHKRLVDHLQQL